MAIISINVDVDVWTDEYMDEFLEEAKDKELIEELNERGYTVSATKSVGPKVITDTWKDEEIAKAYNELSWEEWKELIAEALAKKGRSVPI